VDPDLPTPYEGKFFRSTFTKFFFIFFQSLFYSFRPLLFYPSTTTFWEVMNTLGVVGTDFLLLHFFGFKALGYLFLSEPLTRSMLAGGAAIVTAVALIVRSENREARIVALRRADEEEAATLAA